MIANKGSGISICTCLHGNALSLDVLILTCILQSLLLINPAPRSPIQRLFLPKQTARLHDCHFWNIPKQNKTENLQRILARPAVSLSQDPDFGGLDLVMIFPGLGPCQVSHVRFSAAHLLEHVIASPALPPAAEKSAPAMPQPLLGRCMCASQPAGLH